MSNNTTPAELSATAAANKLSGKVAIITGGASGIGEATARLFADHGAAAVVLADVQDELGLAVAASIGPRRCSYRRCDVADEDQVRSAVDWTVAAHGRLDVFFCCAGVVAPPQALQTVLDLDLSMFDRVVAVNARGAAACVKHAARAMAAGEGGGSIVVAGSVAATRGGGKWTDYVMSKHAVAGLVRSASLQLGRHGIRVNAVSPSGVATPMTVAAYGGASAEELERRYEPLSSLKGAVLRARHVAEAVLFLACDESEFVTGHNLEVHRGYKL